LIKMLRPKAETREARVAFRAVSKGVASFTIAVLRLSGLVSWTTH